MIEDNQLFPPITYALRKKLEEYEPLEGDYVLSTRPIGTLGYARLMELCDQIDAIHASLERENARLYEEIRQMASIDEQIRELSEDE